MLKIYFKTAWRYLVKNKFSSFINIGGLSVGMAVVILISLWIYDELSFNKNFNNYKNIAQVMQNQTFNGVVQTSSSQAMQLAPVLRSIYGGNFKYVVRAGWTNSHLLSLDDKKLIQNGNFMKPEITDLLSLKMLRGTRESLKDISSIILSESISSALFGPADPIGKLIHIDKKMTGKITGVYEDLHSNSSFANLTFIAPWNLMVETDELVKRVTWGNNWFQIFVQVLIMQ